MKKFRVGFYYEEQGFIEIEAGTEEEAEQKVYKILEEDGIEGMDIDCIGREYNVVSSKEIR